MRQRAPLALLLISIFLMTLGLLAGAATAEPLYVKSKTAKLRAGKTSLDSVVADLKVGQAIYADFKTMKVSVQPAGAQPCCSLVNVRAPAVQ